MRYSLFWQEIQKLLFLWSVYRFLERGEWRDTVCALSQCQHRIRCFNWSLQLTTQFSPSGEHQGMNRYFVCRLSHAAKIAWPQILSSFVVRLRNSPLTTHGRNTFYLQSESSLESVIFRWRRTLATSNFICRLNRRRNPQFSVDGARLGATSPFSEQRLHEERDADLLPRSGLPPLLTMAKFLGCLYFLLGCSLAVSTERNTEDVFGRFIGLDQYSDCSSTVDVQ